MGSKGFLALTALAGLATLWGCHQPEYIEIKPDNLTLRQANNSIWLQAQALSHTGVQYPKAPIAWSVKDPRVAQVDSKGRLTPVSSGHTEVIAKTGSVTSSAPVDVLFVEKLEVLPTQLSLKEGGPSVELKVRAFDFRGHELRDRSPTFQSEAPAVASVGQNAVFPVGPGKARIKVQVDSLSQQVEVEVAKGSSSR